ncbi:GNAT family N-acetyltransferase [Shimia sp. MMG029]|uniref:GNAT family N-acetyltransferase n=1 Tax=Shimia sp. MMG029 TaxID=3021978 RepID=UPI0022FEFE3F|nr:GNAT family N-acetyltransferase [Shimia sp. MMG029]MDA5558658.1 GNAT family N-acetyltransferase [Shimia sp. MMG029]
MTPETMAQIHRAAFSDSRAWDSKEIDGLLQSRLVFFVSVDAGFALGRAVADECELLTVAVHPDARRRGFGLLLLEKYEAEAKARGAVTSFLEVAADNTGALALYERCGYETYGTRPRYYTRTDGQQIAASLLRKALN